jgi:hypothetical protein
MEFMNQLVQAVSSTGSTNVLNKVVYDTVKYKSLDKDFVGALPKALAKVDNELLSKVILCPTSYVSHSGHLRGCVYVTKPNYPVEKLLTPHDLLCGVALYSAGNNNIKKDAFLNKKQWTTIPDFSWENDTGKYADYTILTFPKHNATVGIYVVHEDSSKVSNYITVRAYNQHAINVLKEFVASRPGITIKEFYASPEYTRAYSACSESRNKLAYMVSQMIGANIEPHQELDENDEVVYSYLRPMLENIFNFVRPSEATPGEYDFYDHTYCAKDNRNGILYGISRQKGYILYGANYLMEQGELLAEQAAKYEYIFPIGSPMKKFNHKDAQNEAKDSINESIVWGGIVAYHPKVHHDTFDHTFHKSANWNKFLNTVQYDTSSDTLEMHPVCLYISAPDERTVTVEQLMQINSGLKVICLPMTNEEYKRIVCAFHDYKQEHPATTYQQLIVSEDVKIFNVNVELCKKVLQRASERNKDK